MSDTGAVERAAAYASGEWCGECRYGVAEDPPCCTPCPCCGGHSGEHAPRITVVAAAMPSAEEVAGAVALAQNVPFVGPKQRRIAAQVAALWGAR